MIGKRTAFTILEVLVALAVALFLMLGLARAYKLINARISERQSELKLSSELRDIAVRLRNELQQATSTMNPPADANAAEGYLTYYEGAFTSATTTLGSNENPAPIDKSFFRDSRFGDIDDYLAFTARSSKDSPFVGFIPYGVLAARRLANNQLTAAERAAYTHADATRLVPFYSNEAEIVYWASPRFQRDPGDGTLLYGGATPSTTRPLPIDRNADYLPDRIDLHRRVLLIRPDLNMTVDEMTLVNTNYGLAGFANTTPDLARVKMLPFLTRNSGGDLTLVPLSGFVTGQGNHQFNPTQTVNAPADNVPRLNAPGPWQSPAAEATSNAPSWLVGLARVQQFMDLSLHRVTDNWSVDDTTGVTGVNYGQPTEYLACNDLGGLTRPENRFAHVRVPSLITDGAAGASTMPVLALCPPHAYLHSRFTSAPLPPADSTLGDSIQGPPWPATFPAQANDPRLDLGVGDVDFINPYGRFTLMGFLRPEFGLADRVSDQGAGLRAAGEPVAISNRGGSDIIATDVVGFDIRIYDENAPKFIWVGAPAAGNPAPGASGVDDDGDGVTDFIGPGIPDPEELGAPDTDDEAITIDSLRITDALINNGTRTANGEYIFGGAQSPFYVVDRGDFVDLNYMRLAGGPMRGLIHRDLVSGTQLPNGNLAVFSSPYSGVQLPLRTDPITGNTFVPYPEKWMDSGRFIFRGGSGSATLSSFMQPVYDTWTNSYQSDDFNQEGWDAAQNLFVRGPLTAGGPPFILSGVYQQRRVAQNNAATAPSKTVVDSDFALNLSAVIWGNQLPSIGNTGRFEGSSAGVLPVNGVSTKPFVPPAPIEEPLRALKITIRVNDFGENAIRQQTVIQEF
ncbi:hypothetical protein SV7mr_27650 [Stieleria bergensis]|uniref:Uncharacterized protein n=1 Tax=Stieleria bergensis TaxID=2528025 RepID=A0A517SVU4_9BACT|nr:hypothetical protein SV7mr_27650 [Planctomycetes bacterium SV_7m_r]